MNRVPPMTKHLFFPILPAAQTTRLVSARDAATRDPRRAAAKPAAATAALATVAKPSVVGAASAAYDAATPCTLAFVASAARGTAKEGPLDANSAVAPAPTTAGTKPRRAMVRRRRRLWGKMLRDVAIQIPSWILDMWSSDFPCCRWGVRCELSSSWLSPFLNTSTNSCWQLQPYLGPTSLRFQEVSSFQSV